MSSSETLGQWLGRIGLARLEPTFRDNGIDLDVIPLLTDAELKELGLTLGDRKRVLSAATRVGESHPAIARLRPERTVSTRDEAERRQLTVMFCDLVGSTAMSARLDPEDMRGVIRAYQGCVVEVISRYEGFVARYMGDGVLVYFGYPQAHEGDAEQAVNAGLALVDAVPRLQTCLEAPLQVRIGIATGTVVVGDVIGEGIAEEKAVVGDTPNLAARLQALAEPNAIVISASTRRITGGTFEYRDLGSVVLKGLPEPVSAWQVLATSGVETRFEAQQTSLTPLVGREQELGLLLDRWTLAQDGEGQVVLLSGEPGIGKSRMLTALRGRLDVEGVQALRFQCSPYYVNTAFWPTIDNFERALKFGRGEAPESKLDKIEALVVTHHGRPLTDVRFIASILSIPCEERYGALAMTPQKHKDETLRSLVDLAEAAARRQPSVMLYEDVHWADPTSLEVLDLLIDRVHSFPLLILLTHRPEFQSRWGVHGHVTGLNMSKLTRAQSRSMVSKLAGSKSLPAELVEQILAKTDGVPLFVEELTKSILESSELKEASDRYEYAGASHRITIPVTLRDSLMARLDRYTPVKEIAQIGAAIGREFSYELIAAVAPRAKDELDDALGRLTASGLAFRRGTPPEATYTFKHALVQDAAYDSLLKSRRKELHRKIARVIEERSPEIKTNEPEVLAHHFTQAGLTGPAVEWWGKAGEQWLRRSAYVEAAAHLGKAVTLGEALSESHANRLLRLRLQVAYGNALYATRGHAAESTAAFARARALAVGIEDATERYSTYYGLFVGSYIRGELGLARELAEEFLRDSTRKRNVPEAQVAYRMYGMTHWMQGDYRAATQYLERGLALYDPQRDRNITFRFAQDVGVAAMVQLAIVLWPQGEVERARRLVDDGVATGATCGHMMTAAYAHGYAALFEAMRHDPVRAARRIDDLLKLGRQYGSTLFETAATFLYNWTLWHAGQGEAGRTGMHAALDTVVELKFALFRPLMRFLMAEVDAEHGDVEAGLALLDEELAGAPTQRHRSFDAELHRLRGELLLRRPSPDLAAAEQALVRALTLARDQGTRTFELRAAFSLGELYRTRGRIDEARALLVPCLGAVTNKIEVAEVGKAERLLESLSVADVCNPQPGGSL